MFDRFHHREQLLGLVDRHGMDTHQGDHVIAVGAVRLVLDGREIEENGDVLDGSALPVRPFDIRTDRRLEDRDGGVLAEDRSRLLAPGLDVVRLDVGVAAADVLLVDLVEKPADEIRALHADERVDRLAGDGRVRGARHEQRRLGRRVDVPGDPRRRGHLRVHARDVELAVDAERLRLLAVVLGVRVRALRDACRFRVELVAPVLAGASRDRDRRRGGDRCEQSASFHVIR